MKMTTLYNMVILMDYLCQPMPDILAWDMTIPLSPLSPFTCPSWADMQLMTLWLLGNLKSGHISM